MKALRKEFYMEIKKSFSRFISIFLIVALGVAFYAGVRSAEPDMRLSADKYFDDTNLPDIRLVSSIGVSDNNIIDIEKLPFIEDAEGIYYGEYMNVFTDKSAVVKVFSVNEKVGNVSLLEGSMPTKDNECIVDIEYMQNKKISIGDKITLASGTDKAVTDSLKYEEYTITGTFEYSYYFGIDRGSSGIGNGKVEGLIAIDKEAFISSVYTEMYISIKDTKRFDTYGDEYQDKIDSIKDDLEEAFSLSVQKDIEAINEEVKQKYESQGVIIDNPEEISGLSKAEVYVLDRNTIQTYVEFGQDAERIGNIGEIVPMVFFIVAAFVSLTTMTRMVEEQRTQIGTLKALGYSKIKVASKYILYALLATLLGGLTGGIIGSKILPVVIIDAYRIMYYIPELVLPLNGHYFTSAVVISVFCVVTATFVSIYNVLHAVPAELMRPVPPKNGKRVLLEHIGIIWKHMNFSMKSTIRNLMRYKKRLFMTLFGIAGCTALLVIGFGLKDSVNSIITIQYGELRTYDMVIYANNTAIIEDIEGVSDSLMVYEGAVEFEFEENNVAGYVSVFEDKENFKDFMVFRDRNTKEDIELPDDGVVIAEKTATRLGVKAGDTIVVKVSEIEQYEVKVKSVCENYIQQYIFMTEEYYKSVFGEFEYNEKFLILTDNSKEQQENITAKYLENQDVTGITYIDTMREKYMDMLGNLDIITVVLVISAGGLAFIVLYNLNNININERIRELATLKVLGFYDKEVSQYVYRENVISTVVGIIAGMILGKILHQYVIVTAEVDMVMFGRNVEPISYVYSAIITVLFAVIINGLMHFKLKKIDMTTSLKSVE